MGVLTVDGRWVLGYFRDGLRIRCMSSFVLSPILDYNSWSVPVIAVPVIARGSDGASPFLSLVGGCGVQFGDRIESYIQSLSAKVAWWIRAFAMKVWGSMDNCTEH